MDRNIDLSLLLSNYLQGHRIDIKTTTIDEENVNKTLQRIKPINTFEEFVMILLSGKVYTDNGQTVNNSIYIYCPDTIASKKEDIDPFIEGMYFTVVTTNNKMTWTIKPDLDISIVIENVQIGDQKRDYSNYCTDPLFLPTIKRVHYVLMSNGPIGIKLELSIEILRKIYDDNKSKGYIMIDRRPTVDSRKKQKELYGRFVLSDP